MTQKITFHFNIVKISSKFLFLLVCLNSLIALPQLSFALGQNQDTAAKPAAPQIEAAIDLVPGKAMARKLSGTEVHAYKIAIAAGQRANIVVEQRGIDVVVQILGGDKVIAEIDSETRTEGQEHFVLVAEPEVSYRLRVKARYPRYGSGEYEIKAAEPRPASETDRNVFAAYKLITEANTLNSNGKYDDAITAGKKALESAQKGLGPDDAYVGEIDTRLGGFQRLKGDYTNAERSLQQALIINEKSSGKDSFQTAVTMDNLGLVYMALDDDVNAEKFLQQGLETMEKALGKEHPKIALCLTHISLWHQNRGDFQRATEELQRAVTLNQQFLAPDDLSSFSSLHNLGNLYLNQGDLERAEPIFQQVLQIIEKKYGPDHPFVATPLQNLGSIARVKGNFPLALDYLWRAEKIREKALGLQNPDTGSLFINIGNVYRDKGDYTKALELYHRALEALESGAGPYHDYTMMALANIADTSVTIGDSAQAVEYQTRVDQVIEKKIELNLAVGSERHMLAYSDWMSERTDRTISLHILRAPNDPTARDLAALAVVQRKGRVLDALSATSAALREKLKPEDQKLLDELANTDAQLAKVALSGPGKTPPEEYKKRLAGLEEQREKLEGDVNRSSTGYFEKTGPITLAELQAAIPAHAVLAEFAVYRPYDPSVRDDLHAHAFGDPRYVVYIISHDGSLQWKDLGKTKEIDQSLNALRQALRDPERRDVKQLSRAVDQKVFQPLRPLLGKATQLLVSPDGELGLVPFEAFVEETGHYLVEQYSISYLTSGRDLLRMHVERPAKSGPLVVANPFFGEPDTQLAKAETPKLRPLADKRRSITIASDLSSVYFAPLSGTAQEARSIQQLFPDAKVVTGREATTEYLKQADAPSILHIATHGFFLEDPTKKQEQPTGSRASTQSSGKILIENPLLRSGLALAGANINKSGKDNGILTALEASNLNLWGTKLVTLSACDTGVGEVKTGEGIYGFRRVFFRAGAETLVMSLWPVSDNVTREMMTSYYAGLKQGLGRGEALHQAELSMFKKKGRQHPFYWASFIQSGDWTSLKQTDGLQSAMH